jgi:hypothetical protein
MRRLLERRGRAVGAFIAVFVCSPPATARADDDASTARVAQSLFEEGRTLLEAGRYPEACKKLAESQRLDPGGGTLLNLAVCYEKLGRTATAWVTYNDALSLAISDRRSEREAFARAHIADLSARLPRVRIDTEGNAPDITIRLDGDLVPPAALGTTTPVDPGSHSIEASAPDRRPWSTTLTANEGGTITVRVPQLAAIAAPAEAAEESTSSPEPAHRRPVDVHRSEAFWILDGIAVASGGVSVVTGAMALSAHASADRKCDVARSFCADPSGVDDAAKARTYAWVSTAALGASAIAALIAIAWPRDIRIGQSQPKVRVGIATTPGGALLGLGAALP